MGSTIGDKLVYLIRRFPFIGIDFKIPSKVWSRKPIDYYNLKVSRARIVKRVFIDCLKNMKDYKLLKVEYRGLKVES